MQFQDGKIASERIHWDQASALVQLGLLDPVKLPVAGVAAARKVLDPRAPSSELMKTNPQGQGFVAAEPKLNDGQRCHRPRV